jgi:flagellar protein FliS
VEAADPHKLVAILYDALQQSLEIVSLTIDDMRSAARYQHAERAQSILLTLEGNLDHTGGGELARTLAMIYRAMRRELSQITSTQSSERLEKLRIGVETLTTSWAAIRR